MGQNDPVQSSITPYQPPPPQGGGLMQLLSELLKARQAQQNPSTAGAAPTAQQDPTQVSPSGQAAPAVVPPPATNAPQAPVRNADIMPGNRPVPVIVNTIAGLVNKHKADKQANEISRAQSSYDQYRVAIAANDMQTASYIANDPKVVASWEKYLNMYVPRVPGETPSSPSAAGSALGSFKEPPRPGGPAVNTPGGLAVPRDMNPVGPNAQNAAKLATELAHKATYDAETAKNKAEENLYGVQGITDVAKAQADIERTQAELAAAQARELEAKAKFDAQPLENAKLKAETAKELALAQKYRADAEKAAKSAAGAKTLTQFNSAAGRIKDERNFVSKELTGLQNKISKNKGPIDKVFGTEPTPTDEEQAKLTEYSDRLMALSRANSIFSTYQQKVVDGTMTVEEAQLKARAATNLTSDLQLWRGMPDKDSLGNPIPPKPPKGTKNGAVAYDGDKPIGVAYDGEWVAP